MCPLDGPWGPRQLLGRGSGYVLEGSVGRVSPVSSRLCVLGGWEAYNPSTPGCHRRERRRELSLCKPDAQLLPSRGLEDTVAVGASV